MADPADHINPQIEEEPLRDPQPDIVERLTEVLGRLLVQPREHQPPPRQREELKLKLPQYNGIGDVEYFIQQFHQVAEICQWREEIGVLKIREVLIGKAQECGRGSSLEIILANLRVRFGTTQREARNKLRTLRRDIKTTLHDHATEVERLIGLAHPNLPRPYLRELTLETFTSSLGYAGLQKHLLAMQVDTLEAAVRAGTEYLEISTTFNRSDIRSVDEDNMPDNDQCKIAVVEDPTTKMLGGMIDVLQQLVKKIDQIGQTNNPKSTPRPPPTCWNCSEVGHVKGSCPKPLKTKSLN